LNSGARNKLRLASPILVLSILAVGIGSVLDDAPLAAAAALALGALASLMTLSAVSKMVTAAHAEREPSPSVDSVAERLRLELILDRMRDAVLALDADDNLVMANSAAHKLLDLQSDDMGRAFEDAVPIAELGELVQLSRTTSEAMTALTLPKPRSRSMEVRAAQLRTVRGTVIVMHDVTEVQRLERVRRDFVANVSHELRTPVSIIRANAETLLDGALSDTERAPKFVDAIHRNAERLTALITDLLDLATLESGAVELKLVPVMMDEVVDAALESASDRAAERGISLTTDVRSNIAARADATALRQILQNLLDNAIKHTPDGGCIQIRAQPDEEDEETVRVEVEDDGSGVEPQHRKRVFERFYRVDPGRSRQLGGTGLGLSIVKHWVESMGGRVGMKPATERGSVFWVELPREVPPRASSKPPDSLPDNAES
jgi:two-component system phosphate regulon sensor histidine kinase PhoR